MLTIDAQRELGLTDRYIRRGGGCVYTPTAFVSMAVGGPPE